LFHHLSWWDAVEKEEDGGEAHGEEYLYSSGGRQAAAYYVPKTVTAESAC
jgi:hypothetical protein